jgi:hypothetical protein
MNDPNVFALTLMLWGLVWFVWAERNGKATVPAFAAMALGGFYKHSLFAAPATAFCWLVLTDRRAALRGLVTGLVVVACAVLIFFFMYGNDFIYQMTAPRVMTIKRVISGLGRLQFVAPAFVVWLVWVIAERRQPAAKFSAIFVFWAALSHFLQQSGEGVSDNSEFELIAAVGVGVGLAFSRVMPMQQMQRNQIAILLLLIVRFVLTDRIEPYLLVTSADFRNQAPQAVIVAQRETKRIAAIPGAVDCTIQMICFDAGKAFVWDSFPLDQRIAYGTLTKEAVQASIRAQRLRFEINDKRAEFDALRTYALAKFRDAMKSITRQSTN